MHSIEMERAQDARIRAHAHQHVPRAMQDAESVCGVRNPSDPTHEDPWLSEVILTSLGVFLTREDAIDCATALRSTLLLMEALAASEHWGGVDPRCLSDVLLEYETFGLGHQGPRRGYGRDPGGEEDFVYGRRKAA